MDEIYVAVRKRQLGDLLEVAAAAVEALSRDNPHDALASCLNGAVNEIRSDVRELV